MLEIIILFLMCRNIGTIVRKNGRNAIGFQLALIGLWIAGEILGGFVGAMVTMMVDGRYEGVGVLTYLFALLGAGIGAFIAFRIARSTAPKPAGLGFPVVMKYPAETMERHAE
jgi:hypothetical protein